jgi:hypothetical protein
LCCNQLGELLDVLRIGTGRDETERRRDGITFALHLSAAEMGINGGASSRACFVIHNHDVRTRIERRKDSPPTP